MTARFVLTVALAALSVSGVDAADGRGCSDACIGAARAERHDCATSATGAFLDGVAGCIGRDHVCVDACATERQDCRDGTTLGADLARCDGERAAAELRCRTTFPSHPRRLAIYIGRARIDGFGCRRAAARALRIGLHDCRTRFRTCLDACGENGPPAAKACRADASAAQRHALDQCALAYRATASACIEREVGCVEACADGRATCKAPTLAMLDTAFGACTAARNADVAACRAASPDGGAALDACVQSALATAYECRQAGLAAAAPGLEACTAAYASCVRSCPPGAQP